MSLKLGGEAIGSWFSFSDEIVLPGADQREGRRVPKVPLVFLSKKGLGFLLWLALIGASDRSPTNGRGRCKAYALRFGRTLWKSLRLASCMPRAASVSDCS
jgi:hypothetical protein